MSVRIRLRRMGSKKRPFYRVVVADQRSPRDGRFIENIGKYHPLDEPSIIDIDEERAMHWLSEGAQPSESVQRLMEKAGIWEKFEAARPKKPKKAAKPKAMKAESGAKPKAKAKKEKEPAAS